MDGSGSVLTEKGEQTMPDREKIIKGLHQHCEGSVFDRCGECPYYEIDHEPFICRDMLLSDLNAIVKTGHWIVLTFCANEGIYCSECHMKIFDRITKPKQKLSQYCPHCGSRNEQFFRDGEVVFR